MLGLAVSLNVSVTDTDSDKRSDWIFSVCAAVRFPVQRANSETNGW